MRATRSDDTILRAVRRRSLHRARGASRDSPARRLFVLGIFAWARTDLRAHLRAIAQRARRSRGGRGVQEAIGRARRPLARPWHPMMQHSVAEMDMEPDAIARAHRARRR